jgi:hypothetical protein
VRRAAFLRAGKPDPTPSYLHRNLKGAAPSGNASDINAVAIAYLRYRSEGLRPLAAGALTFAPAPDRHAYERVVEAGINELGAYLKHEGII